MKQTNSHNLPKARKNGILTREIPGELLVYDTKRHRAYCLNETAGFIWKQCNGKRTVFQLARKLEQSCGDSVDERLVWLALEQLEKNQLLDERFSFSSRAIMTRRKLISSLGLASVVALPIVASIIAPTAVQAASCLPGGIQPSNCNSVARVGCCCTNSKTCTQTAPGVFNCVNPGC